MWAMIPMLRVRASGNCRMAGASAMSVYWGSLMQQPGPRPGCEGRGSGRLPAVMGEGLVGLRHLVHVLSALHRRADAVARIKELGRETLRHGLFPPLPGVSHQPADRQGGGPAGAHLDRHLVGGAADPTALHLEG